MDLKDGPLESHEQGLSNVLSPSSIGFVEVDRELRKKGMNVEKGWKWKPPPVAKMTKTRQNENENLQTMTNRDDW